MVMVEAAGIELATTYRNLLIYIALIFDLPILGRKWGIIDAFSLTLKFTTQELTFKPINFKLDHQGFLMPLHI